MAQAEPKNTARKTFVTSMNNMRNIINLVENDLDDDFEYDEIEQPEIPFQFLNSLDRYKALKHKERQSNRPKWREQQQRRYRNDIKDYENTEFMSKRCSLILN